MGTYKFLTILVISLVLVQLCICYPNGESDSNEDDFSQQQQQQNIDSDSLEQLTQRIKGNRRKPPKLQMPEKESVAKPYDPCLDPQSEGPCRAFKPRYFFNQVSGNCEPFMWGGCGKNGNNFRELSDCETSCAKHLSTGKLDEKKADEPSRVETCEKPPVNPGPVCTAYIPRWTYNATELACQQVIWGGCAKTENNFATESLCEATCGEYPQLKGLSEPEPTQDPSQHQNIPVNSPDQNICDLPFDAGICLAMFEKYYFNKLNNRCEPFVYGGCGGNKNRFDTPQDCVRACGGDSPSTDVKCTDVECPWALYDHYESLGCSPIYDGDSCCPTRYECPDQQEGVQNNTLESRSLTLEKEPENDRGTTASPDVTLPQKCRYKGKTYSVGEMVDEASDTGNCRAACTCVDSGSELGPSIICAQIECPEYLSGRPRGKENCIPLYKRGSCCAYDYYCPPEGELTIVDPNQHQTEEKVLAKCEANGESAYEGQRVYPNKSPCSKCLCEKNPANATSLEGQLFCEKVDCGIEIYYAHHLARGCAPVYYEKSDGTTTCCPISWQCPEEAQPESERKDEEATTPGSTVPDPPSPTSSSADRPLPPTPPNSPLVRNKDACRMEKVEGNCKGHRPRYFFNGVTAKCENFMYTGCEGNLNNFASLEDCQELCEGNDQPLAPVPPSPPAKGAKTIPAGGLLGRSRQAETTPSEQQETKYISLREVDPCTMPKRVGRCKGFFPRFFYSPEDNECKLFIFGGCHPNANNFYSKESCEATCLNNIPVENLQTNVPAQLAMISSSRRLNTEEGDSSRVNFGDNTEPRLSQPEIPQSASAEEENSECKLPPRTGRCKAFVRRFYYDSDRKSCRSFTYGGCSGNANNFKTIDDCNEKCLPKVGLHSNNQLGPRRRLNWRVANVDGGSGGNWHSTPVPPEASQPSGTNVLPRSTSSSTAKCMLPKSSGSCHNSIRSYYYDAETKSCKLFFYSGCFGNANRFSGREECENVCKKPLESSQGNPTTESSTNQPNRPSVHELVDSSETENAQDSQKSSEKDFCKEDPVPGDCAENQLRFYYDPTAETCLPFVYTGCKGNKNNFVTEAECMSSCGKSPTLEQLADQMVLSCSFGNRTVPWGTTVGAQDETEYSGEEPPCGVPVCQCITPPAVTCVHRMCPEPTTTTTTQLPKICATPTCLHFCRETIGLDGCPTCDCDYNNNRINQWSSSRGLFWYSSRIQGTPKFMPQLFLSVQAAPGLQRNSCQYTKKKRRKRLQQFMQNHNFV